MRHLARSLGSDSFVHTHTDILQLQLLVIHFALDFVDSVLSFSDRLMCSFIYLSYKLNYGVIFL